MAAKGVRPLRFTALEAAAKSDGDPDGEGAYAGVPIPSHRERTAAAKTYNARLRRFAAARQRVAAQVGEVAKRSVDVRGLHRGLKRAVQIVPVQRHRPLREHGLEELHQVEDEVTLAAQHVLLERAQVRAEGVPNQHDVQEPLVRRRELSSV